MKKIVLFILFGLFAGGVFAQDPGAAEKNAGNDALKAKNYAEAFNKYEAYLKIVNYNDKATVFNTAYCANKIKNYEAAEKYFDMSIKNNYKTATSYAGKAQAEEDLNKENEMLATLEAGLKAFPKNARLEKMYGTYFLKKGVDAQKAGRVELASESYSKILSLSDKALKGKAYMALASLYFNNGATILQKATPIATSDREKYEAEKTRATAEFKRALGYVEQAKSLDPESQEVKDLGEQIKKAMK